jgi:putative sterol carrier protein
MADVQAEGQLQEVRELTIEECLESFRKKFYDPRVVKDYKGWSGKIMLYHFTDSDAYYHIRFVNGEPQPAAAGKAEKADVTYEMSTQIFRALTRKEISGLKAFAMGKVKVKAAMPDLLKLQKLDSL